MVAARRARARSGRSRRRRRRAGRDGAPRAPRARGRPTRSRPSGRSPRRLAWISCALAQQSWPDIRSRTAARAPPARKPASRRACSVCSRQDRTAAIEKMIAILIGVLGCPSVKTRIVLTLIAAATLAGVRRQLEAPADDRRRRVLPAGLRRPADRRRRSRRRNLTPPGVEPHDLELSGSDVRTIADADLVLYLGAGLPAGARGRDRLDVGARRRPPRRARREAKDRPARLARSDPVRRDRRADRRGARPPPGGRARSRRGCAPSTASSAAASPAASDTRSSRATPRSATWPSATGSSRWRSRASRRRPSRRRATSRTSCARCARSARRPSSSRRSSRPGSPRRSRARSARRPPCSTRSRASPTKEAAAGEDYFSVMRENLAALRKALGCR